MTHLLVRYAHRVLPKREDEEWGKGKEYERKKIGWICLIFVSMCGRMFVSLVGRREVPRLRACQDCLLCGTVSHLSQYVWLLNNWLLKRRMSYGGFDGSV